MKVRARVMKYETVEVEIPDYYEVLDREDATYVYGEDSLEVNDFFDAVQDRVEGEVQCINGEHIEILGTYY